MLKKHGLGDFSDPDAFFDLFYDEDIRFEYILKFKKLTRAFNLVLPRKEALDYFADYQNFSEINELAHKHFRDSRLSMRGIPAKLRAIADEYLKSKGVDQKVRRFQFWIRNSRRTSACGDGARPKRPRSSMLSGTSSK